LKEKKPMNQPGNSNQRGRLNTIYLLIKIAYFEKTRKILLQFERNYLVQGGQPYGALSYSKDSLHQLPCMFKAGKSISNLFIIMSVIERKKTNESTRKPYPRWKAQYYRNDISIKSSNVKT
jgi:hypothetical protein